MGGSGLADPCLTTLRLRVLVSLCGVLAPSSPASVDVVASPVLLSEKPEPEAEAEAEPEAEAEAEAEEGF